MFLQDISLRATTFSADNLRRQVLRSGDFFQLQVEVSGGSVLWLKDGEIVPKIVQPYCDRAGHLVNVDQPDRTQLLEPGTYPDRPTQSWHDFIPSKEHFPPNRRHSFLGGRCQVCCIFGRIFSWSLMKISLQVKDAGVYQAKVVSAAGVYYSSPITVEVEPGPEWEGVTSGWIGSKANNRPCLKVSPHYGAKWGVMECENKEEAEEYRRKYRVYGFPHMGDGPHWAPAGWIEGTVGSWEVKMCSKERELVEKEGKQALHAEIERKKLAKWLLEQPFAQTLDEIEQRRTDSKQFAVADAVRDALFNIWVKQDYELDVQLEHNYKNLCHYLSGDCYWPSRPLVRCPKKLLVKTTLNHTRETHLKWELELADDWEECFDYKYDWTIRWNSGPNVGGFRTKRQTPKHLNLVPETSSSDSWSSSDSEEEGLSKGARTDCVTLYDAWKEDLSEVSSDDQEEEDAVSRLQGLLLRCHDEEKASKMISFNLTQNTLKLWITACAFRTWILWISQPAPPVMPWCRTSRDPKSK